MCTHRGDTHCPLDAVTEAVECNVVPRTAEAVPTAKNGAAESRHMMGTAASESSEFCFFVKGNRQVMQKYFDQT